MTYEELIRRRLHNQQLSQHQFTTPEALVKYMGAVQSQDYPGAKWGLSQRLPGITEAQLDKAFDDGKILRTHVMRPTWHFVAAEDIRWMQMLTGQKVKRVMNYYDKRIGVTPEAIKEAHAIIKNALKGKNYLTRDELKAEFRKAGIKTDGNKVMHLVSHAELDGLICSGPRKGKKQTYALIEERAPKAKELTRDQALTELVERFFISHGPATFKDFSWWSGLGMGDGKRGMELSKMKFEKAEIDGVEYWHKEDGAKRKKDISQAYLLPNYDEYGIAYVNRDAILNPRHKKNLIFGHIAMVGGRIVGTWKKKPKKGGIEVGLNLFEKISAREREMFKDCAARYAKFLGLKHAE